MGAEQLAQAVRRQLEFGRLVPLGPAAEGAWLAERAAEVVLREAAGAVPGVRLGSLRLALADPGQADAEAARAAAEGPQDARPPRPASALPPGPLRMTAEFAAAADRPLPESAEHLRTALARAAEQRIGLEVSAVDLHVTGLLDEAPDGTGVSGDAAGGEEAGGGEAVERAGEDAGSPAAVPPSGVAAAVAAAVLAVPGVLRLSASPVGAVRAVRAEDGQVEVQLTVSRERRILDVVRDARRVTVAAAGTERVAVTVTEVS
ncbi:hypothetical protein PJ985_12735 [Streptomyces sp. ACA25]|uniref:hypothetical protein n=1 Tax=Streptomyces sp. ACA25 TaxID=3022596 RepID=UPI002307BFAE|nr:hypothetical protein [Streptomyces sp. ACA25]MDB1088431.1 hypothetical protein [Streptomyces sp. ACA25]